MLKYISFHFFILISISSSAQYNSEGADLISRFKPGAMWFNSGFRPTHSENIHKYDRLIVDLTYNDWNGDLKIFKNKWNSIGFNTSLMFDIPITKGNTMSFGTGLTYSLFRINHDNEFIVDSTNTYTKYTLLSTPDYKTRVLGGNSISIPLELRFRTKGWKHFKFHIGGKIGYQLNMYSKTIWQGDNGRNKLKSHAFPDVDRLLYSAHFRIGVRNWALFGSYNFNTLFSNAKSTNLNLVQIGVSLSLF